ncbi:hypothetical protein LXL04_018328 [Taraxacum kok-saghyz]
MRSIKCKISHVQRIRTRTRVDVPTNHHLQHHHRRKEIPSLASYPRTKLDSIPSSSTLHPRSINSPISSPIPLTSTSFLHRSFDGFASRFLIVTLLSFIGFD